MSTKKSKKRKWNEKWNNDDESGFFCKKNGCGCDCYGIRTKKASKHNLEFNTKLGNFLKEVLELIASNKMSYELYSSLFCAVFESFFHACNTI